MRNFTKLFFILNITILLLGSVFFSQTSAKEKEKSVIDLDEILQSDAERDRLIKMQRLLKAYRWLGIYDGVAMIVKDGKPIYKYASGYANLDYTVQASLSTQFNTAYITQAFTATALMQLVEQGKVDLKANIATYLPETVGNIGEKITVHQLLTHTSGIADYYEIQAYYNKFLRIGKIDDLIKIILEEQLMFEPNSKIHESNSNYVFLAKIIENQSGESYQKYLKKNVLSKCNLSKDAGLYNWNEIIRNKAVGYDKKEDEVITFANFEGAFPFGADAMYCSVEDLVGFSDAFFKNKLLSQESKDIMTKNYTLEENLSFESESGYGYGWKVKLENGNRIVYQGGLISGLSSQVRHYEEEGYTIIILCNRNIDVDVALEMSEKLDEIFFDPDYYMPHHPFSYVLNEIIKEKDLDYVVENFDDIVKEGNYDIDRVWILNGLSRDFTFAKNWESALAIAKINQRLFPQEDIVYESLGEAYYKLGQYDLARQNYQRRLALLPNDKRAIEMLKIIDETEKTGMVMNAGGVTAKKVVTTKSAPPKNTESRPTQALTSNSATADKVAKQETKKEVANFENDIKKDEILADSDLSAPIEYENLAPEIYTITDVMPQYPEGQTGLFAYISSNLRYPKEAYDKGVEGTVYVKCVINENGVISNVQIDKGLEDSSMGCEREAMRLVRQMPAWKAGVHNGKKVKVKYIIPVRFKKDIK
ncbi:MAG: TonB family protein [Chitinophagales bacterium]